MLAYIALLVSVIWINKKQQQQLIDFYIAYLSLFEYVA